LGLACCNGRAELVSTGFADVLKGADHFEVFFTLYIKNSEQKPVRIATGGFTQYSAATPTSLTSNIEWDFASAPDKSRLILSESELKIVKLEPGETAVLKWSRSELTSDHLSAVNIRLLVNKDFAKRFGIWCGEVNLDKITVFMNH
jgi:hypothetical protein